MIEFGSGDAVDLRVEGFHPSEHVIEGSILLDENDDGFDLPVCRHFRVCFHLHLARWV